MVTTGWRSGADEWLDHHTFFADVLPACLGEGAWCLIDFHFLHSSWKEVADMYGIHPADEAIEAVKALIGAMVPANVCLAESGHHRHYLVLIEGDTGQGADLAQTIVERLAAVPVQMTWGPAQFSVVAGVVDSETHPSAAELAYNALWLALNVAHEKRRVAF